MRKALDARGCCKCPGTTKTGVSDFEVECGEPQVHFHMEEILTHDGGSGESHCTAFVQRNECYAY